MAEQQSNSEKKLYTQEELNALTLQTIGKLMGTYSGKDRVITPENTYQPAITGGRATMESFMELLMLPGSGIQGLENLDDCLERLAKGEQVLFLADHICNMDVPLFNSLLRREHPRYLDILERLVYIAGRKLNESSDLMKMFSEMYSRLVIVPRRDYPPEKPDETPEEHAEREQFEQYAMRINRAAFREMGRLRKKGHIFVLFPLGGRYKPGKANEPVKETTSYLNHFNTVYLISMEGNVLPVKDRMEEERPVHDKVVYRVSPALNTADFLASQKEKFTQASQAGALPEGMEFEEYTVKRIMAMLDEVRQTGKYKD